jgi:hypothetical protein
MQTTVEVPRHLYEQAEQAARRAGESLQQFIAAAIEQRIRSNPTANGSRQRVQLPLVRSKDPLSRQLTAERVAEILDEEDVSA